MSSPSPARSSDDPLNCRRQLEGDRQRTRRRRQQRRGLGASAVSERSAEDTNLLSIPNSPPRRNVTHGVMSERYRLGGRVETDTVAMAAARQDQAGILRRRRLERRHGHRHPLLSRWLLATRYLKAQKNLHHSTLYNPLILPSLETSLGVDVLLYPMILPSLGLACGPPPSDRVAAVTLCPRQTGDAVCRRCFLKDKDKEPFLMSDDHDMDPSEVPAHLPALSQVEEMLIARCIFILRPSGFVVFNISILVTPIGSTIWSRVEGLPCRDQRWQKPTGIPL
ncbi:hypothetical protein V8E54_002401 [Elaphomyces granulatus]